MTMCLLVLAQGAIAEEVLSVSVEICQNDSVNVRYIDLEDAYPSRYISPGEYRLEIGDGSAAIVYKTDFKVSFFLLSNPPMIINCSLINMRIPYSSSMKNLIIYRKDKKIFSQALSLCNNNGLCDAGYETYPTCPKDCPSGYRDGYCDGIEDGRCDPDCAKGGDIDCMNITYKRWAMNPKKIWNASSLGINDTNVDAEPSVIDKTASKGAWQNYLPVLLISSAAVLLGYALFKRKKRD